MPDFIRATRNALEVPVQTWANDHQTVTLIGMVHLADPRFYTDTAAIIDALEDDGCTIYAEGTSYADGATPGIKLLQTLVMHEVFTDLVHQSIALPRLERWRNVDLTVEQMLEAAEDPVGMRKLLTSGFPVTDRSATTTIAALLRPAITPLLAATAMVVGTGVVKNEATILTARNQHVMDAVLTAGHDAALVWGTAHLPGMGEILTGAGFRLESTSWRPAMAKRRLVDGIRDAVATCRTQSDWPWEGQDVPETIPGRNARALARERGWLTDPVPS